LPGDRVARASGLDAETEVVIMCGRKLFPHVAVVGMTVLTILGLTAGARAQHTPDPYNIVGEYNVGYEDSMYPTYPNGAGFSPNQGILQGARPSRANTFQSYLDSLDGGSDALFGASFRSRGGAGVPYYRAHKEFDDAFDRVYTPNAAPDQAFRADQAARTKLYVEYLKEADPKKRAQLYRQYNQQSLRTARDSGAGSARATLRSRNSSAAPVATPATSRASAFRIPSRIPSPLARPGGAGRSSASETPDDILDRALRAARPSAPASGTRSSAADPR
jgi:hypothetical protein